MLIIMTVTLDGIISSLTNNDIVAGAILGSIIIPLIFYLILFLHRKYISLLPANSLLGQFKDNEIECLFFLKELYDIQKSNEYLFKIPDFFPPHTTMKEQRAINIPRVFAKADTECLNDVMNVLGTVGKNKNIEIASIETDWDVWNKPLISIGGNYKTERILERCKPIYVEQGFADIDLNGKKEKSYYFKLKNKKEKLFAIIPDDYGIVHKTKDISTGNDVFFILGLGCLATESVGRFFRSQFLQLGKMYGNRPFVAIIKSNLYEGKESYVLYDYYPEPTFIRKIVFPITWFKHFKHEKKILRK